MTANIKQNNFSVSNDNGKRDSITVGNADGLNIFKISTKLMILQVWLKWIAFQISKYGNELVLQYGMAFDEFFSRTGEACTPKRECTCANLPA